MPLIFAGRGFTGCGKAKLFVIPFTVNRGALRPEESHFSRV